MISRLLSVLICFLLPFGVRAASSSVIFIDSQESFECLQKKFDAAIANGGKNITVEFAPGRYFFNEKHLCIINRRLPNVSVTFKGNNAVLTGSGPVAQADDPFNVNSAYLDSDAVLPRFGQSFKARSIAVNVEDDLYRIKVPWAALKGVKDGYLKITEAYEAHNYLIEKIKARKVFFRAQSGDLLNKDFTFGAQMPRVRFSLRPSGSNLRRCDACCFLYVYGSTLKSLTIEDLDFFGNGSVQYMSLFRTINVESEGFYVKSCSFRGLAGNLMEAQNTSNIRFSNNTISYCEGFGLTADVRCFNTVAESNNFVYTGLGMGPTFCICVRGEDYLVKNNDFCNFGYCAVAVGVFYADEIPTKSCGIVEGNRMYYTEDYISSIEDYQVMDGGAIYVFTRNDGAVIRNNIIHDIAGRYQNRGIFLDDGAYGVEISGNTVYNIHNSYCIDSRRVKAFERSIDPLSKTERTNVNNSVFGNIVDGDIRFEPREGEDNGCYIGTNYKK